MRWSPQTGTLMSKRSADATVSKRKPGRPAEAVPDRFADEICEWIAQGKTLREYCRQPNKPDWTTVYAWKRKDEAFHQRFVRAREDGADAIAEECLELIDTEPERAIIESGEGRSSSRVDTGYVQWKRNQVEQRLKLLAKWHPAKYGERIDVTSGNEPLTVVFTNEAARRTAS